MNKYYLYNLHINIYHLEIFFPDAGKDWRQDEKGMTEDEMIGWHHWLNGHEFEQTSGDGKDREAWHAAVPGVTKSWTHMSNWITNKSFKKPI